MFNNRRYETQRAYEILVKGKKGDTIDAETMAQHIGRECWDSRGEGYRCVNSGMRQAIKAGVYWYRDRDGKQYVCGTVDSINEAQRSYIKKSNKIAKKSLDVALCAKSEEMTPSQLSQHNLNTLVAGMIVTATSAPTRKRLEGRKYSQPSPDDLMKLVLKTGD